MEPKKEINIILIGFGIISFLLLILVIYPLFQRIKENSDILVVQGKELTLFEIKIRDFEKSKQSYQVLEIEEQLRPFFVDPEIDTDFIEFLENTAQVHQISIGISRYSFKESEIDIWSSRGYAISCTGSFQNILRFIGKLETAPYLIKVQNLTIEREGEVKIGQEETFKISLLIKTYSKNLKD